MGNLDNKNSADSAGVDPSELIVEALKEADGDVRVAAENLGIGIDFVRKKVETLGIDLSSLNEDKSELEKIDHLGMIDVLESNDRDPVKVADYFGASILQLENRLGELGMNIDSAIQDVAYHYPAPWKLVYAEQKMPRTDEEIREQVERTTFALETELILDALTKTNWNIPIAAQLLMISQKTLKKKMDERSLKWE